MNYHIKNFAKKMFPSLSRKIFYSFNIIRYKGDKYFCPICEKGSGNFLTGPDKTRKNSKCPKCGSLERHRLLWLYMIEILEIKNRKINLLNIAPDYATQSALKRLGNISYTSVDLNSPLATKKNDITNLEFNDNSFDAILCYHVLEHIENDKKAMSEILRVLKPDGWAILQSPVETDRAITFEDNTITTQFERMQLFGQEDHVRIYGRDYTARIEDVGFKVKGDKFINKVTLTEIEKYVLDSNEVIYFCTKNGFFKK